MDLVAPLVRHVTYDLFQRRDGFAPHRYRQTLATTQFLSADEIASLQLRLLKRVLREAYAANAFYRNRFDKCGFQPDDLHDLSDLRSLPILTKDEIRNELVHHPSNGYSPENTYPRRTGGSTGTPLLVYHDYEALSQKKAAAERHNSWADWTIGDPVAYVWGDASALAKWRTRLRNALSTRAVYLDTLEFDSEHIEIFLHHVARARCKVLFGHAHSLYRLAEYVSDRGQHCRFRTVIATSMVLSPGERRTIEEVFAARVYNRYGCHETSIISSECDAHEGMHVFAEGVLVELIGEDASVPRKIVLTDLLNRAMPLIRYEVGDYGAFANGRCPCGRALPRLAEIAGRSADFLYTPDGKPVFGLSVLDTFVIHIPGIRQLQIIQDRLDHLQFRLVKDRSFSNDTIALLRWEVWRVFGDRMRYDVQLVENIQQTERGKYRFSICNVPGLRRETVLS